MDQLAGEPEYDYERKIESSESLLEIVFGAIVGFFEFLSSFYGMIFLLILFALLILIAYKQKVKAKLKVQQNSEPIDMVMDSNRDKSNKNLQKLAENAVSEEKFRLGIRYYFLFVLEQLDKQKLIRFHPEKTNRHYLQELPRGLQNEFSQLSRIFDYTWYGNYPVELKMFLQVKQLAKQIMSEGDGT